MKKNTISVSVASCFPLELKDSLEKLFIALGIEQMRQREQIALALEFSQLARQRYIQRVKDQNDHCSYREHVERLISEILETRL